MYSYSLIGRHTATSSLKTAKWHPLVSFAPPDITQICALATLATILINYYIQHDVPKQTNGHDCGAFTCIIIVSLIRILQTTKYIAVIFSYHSVCSS